MSCIKYSVPVFGPRHTPAKIKQGDQELTNMPHAFTANVSDFFYWQGFGSHIVVLTSPSSLQGTWIGLGIHWTIQIEHTPLIWIAIINLDCYQFIIKAGCFFTLSVSSTYPLSKVLDIWQALRTAMIV